MRGGREGGAVVVTSANGADGAAYEHRGIGGVDWGLGRDRHLELPRRVLGMELLDLDPLGTKGADEIANVVRYADQPGHAIRGTDCRRDEVITVAR